MGKRQDAEAALNWMINVVDIFTLIAMIPEESEKGDTEALKDEES